MGVSMIVQAIAAEMLRDRETRIAKRGPSIAIGTLDSPPGSLHGDLEGFDLRPVLRALFLRVRDATTAANPGPTV